MGKKLVLLLAFYMAGCMNDKSPPFGRPSSMTLLSNNKEVCIIQNVYLVSEGPDWTSIYSVDESGARTEILRFRNIINTWKWNTDIESGK